MSVSDLSFVVSLLCTLVNVRTFFVVRFRQLICEQFDTYVHEDMAVGRPFMWRWHVFQQVSYNSMVWRFWRPLRPERWWADTSFLHRTVNMVTLEVMPHETRH